MACTQVGITQYVNASNQPLRAVLKKCCDDFEVREISLNNSIAGVSHFSSITTSSKKSKVDEVNAVSTAQGNKDETAVGTSSEKSNVKSREKSDNAADKDIKCDDADKNTGESLETTDNESKNDMLENDVSEESISDKTYKIEPIQWMTSVKEIYEFLNSMLPNDVIAQIETFSESSEELNLGCINAKVDRSLMHEAIRYINPYIETKTLTESGQSKMICCFYSNVNLLLGTFPTEQNVKDFLRFVNCRNLMKHLADETENFDRDLYTYDIPTEQLTKEERKKVHNAIQKCYHKLILNKSIRKMDKSYISVRFRPKPLSGVKRNVESNMIMEFVLRKRNLEMIEALSMVAERLNVNLSKVSYAGMKDKKAVTYQFITVRDVAADTITHVGGASRGNGDWSISSPLESSDMLQPGELKGNHFVIRARDVRPLNTQGEASTACNVEDLRKTISASTERIQQNGFVNYFGQQRFGESGETPEIGLALLNLDYQRAVQLIMSPRTHSSDSELSYKEKAKKYFSETGDIKGTLKMLPQYNNRERMILKGFLRFGADSFRAAFNGIPIHARMLYIHSYTSLVWNQVVSKRIEIHGFQVLPGDLVERDGEIITLQENDISSYSIHDILLPLPGIAVRYPDNDTKIMYENILSADKVSRENFEAVKKFDGNVNGSYRKMFIRPSNFQADVFPSEDDRDKGCDVVMSFDLPPSCYATMLARELFHQ